MLKNTSALCVPESILGASRCAMAHTAVVQETRLTLPQLPLIDMESKHKQQEVKFNGGVVGHWNVDKTGSSYCKYETYQGFHSTGRCTEEVKR